jgi:hypothetical protein
VPALVLSGRADVRTPLKDALAVQKLIPGAQVATIPFTGHSTLSSDQTDCVKAALEAFFAGAAQPACGATDNPFSPTRRPPASLSVLKAVAGVAGKRGRTVAAVRETILDALRQIIGDTFAFGRTPARVGGLRRGNGVLSATKVTLRRYSYVPGVELSGAVSPEGAGTVTVRGRAAARGRLTISENGAVTGELSGRRITTSVASIRLPRLRAR